MQQDGHTRTAVVTGASSGMGLGIAERFAVEGFRTVLIGRSASKVEAELSRLADKGLDVVGGAFDVRDPAAVAAGFALAGDSIDVAVNAAGVVYPGSIADADPAQWKDVIETNVLGVMYGSREAMLRMTTGGYIINVSSTSGREPSKVAAYCASKFAVTGFTECLRREVAPAGIRVTCLEPGLVWTDFNRHMPEAFQEMRRDVPSLTPAEVAEVAWQLVSLPDHVDVGELVLRPVSQVA